MTLKSQQKSQKLWMNKEWSNNHINLQWKTMKIHNKSSSLRIMKDSMIYQRNNNLRMNSMMNLKNKMLGWVHQKVKIKIKEKWWNKMLIRLKLRKNKRKTLTKWEKKKHSKLKIRNLMEKNKYFWVIINNSKKDKF